MKFLFSLLTSETELGREKRLHLVLNTKSCNSCRIPSVYKESVDYFAMSGLTLREIVDRAHKSGQTVADGLIHFLDNRLLGSDEPVKVSEVSNKLIILR